MSRKVAHEGRGGRVAHSRDTSSRTGGMLPAKETAKADPRVRRPVRAKATNPIAVTANGVVRQAFQAGPALRRRRTSSAAWMPTERGRAAMKTRAQKIVV